MKWAVAALLLGSGSGCFLLGGDEAGCEEDADCPGTGTCRSGACVEICAPQSQEQACAGIFDATERDDGCGTPIVCPCAGEPDEELCAGVVSGFRVDRCLHVRTCTCVDDCATLGLGATNACGDRCLESIAGFVDLAARDEAVVPEKRAYGGLAWSPTLSRGVLHGGEQGPPPKPGPLRSFTFALVDTITGPRIDWRPIEGCASEQSVTAHAVVWHPQLARFVAIGGWGADDAEFEGRIWASDGGCFEPLAAPSMGPSPEAPGLRRNLAAASDGLAVYVLGGQSPAANPALPGSFEPWQLWRWDGSGWSASRVVVSPDPKLAVLAAGAMTWSARDGLVWFGGESFDPTFAEALGGTATIDPATSTASWEAPGDDGWARTRLAMAYASGPEVVVRTTGKRSSGSYAAETFALGPRGWIELEDLLAPPPPTTGATMIDVPGWGLLLFGGYEKVGRADDYSNRARLFSNRALRKRLGLSREP